MKNVIIYGAGEYGKNAARKLKNNSEFKLLGFYDTYKSNMEELEFIDLENRFVEYVRDCYVIICMYNWKGQISVYKKLRNWGFREIYIYRNKEVSFGKNFLESECLYCGNHYDNELVYLETHLVDFCNLNCRGCTHFSPLFSNEFQLLERCREDINCLKDKVEGIRVLFLMGGEPLLNPDIMKYIEMYRQELPNTQLGIVTNGLLLLKMKKEFFECLRNNDVMISISEYKPTHRIIEEIKECLEKNRIDYGIRKYETKAKFSIAYTVNNNTSRERYCLAPGCINIWNGKVSPCPSVMYIHKFNEKFNENMPQEGIIDLYNTELQGKELLDVLYGKIPLCNHCVKGEIEWEICKTPKKEDFAWSD